jgi:cobalamin biosynthesis protein CobT
MQVKTLSSGDGYAKFGKGENAYIKPIEITPGVNDYADEDDETDQQLNFVFQAKSAEEGDIGRIPGYINSKITIQEDDNFSSNLGKLLQAAGKLEAVLKDVGLDEETIEAIKAGDDRCFAADEQDNQELFAAVVNRLDNVDDLVLKAGTKFAGDDEDYSKVKDIIERVDKDVPPPQDSDESAAEAEDADAEGADADADAGEQPVSA